MVDADFEYSEETNTLKITNNETSNNETIIIGEDNVLVEITSDGEVASVTIENIQW